MLPVGAKGRRRWTTVQMAKADMGARDYGGVFGFRNRTDADRFLDAFRAAMA